MKKMTIHEFFNCTDEIIVNTKTIEEHKAFITECNLLGYKTASNDAYTNCCWICYGQDACYDNNGGMGSSIAYENCNIISMDDIIIVSNIVDISVKKNDIYYDIYVNNKRVSWFIDEKTPIPDTKILNAILDKEFSTPQLIKYLLKYYLEEENVNKDE